MLSQPVYVYAVRNRLHKLTTTRSDYQTPTLIVTISNLIFSLASLLLEFLSSAQICA